MLDFTPKADPVTGGTAVAKLITIDPPLKPFKIGEPTTSDNTIKVFFDIIKTGSYNFVATDPATITGATTGLSVQKMEGKFPTAETDKSLDFTISGTPETSLEGNSFKVSKAVTLNTGKIKGFPAICDGSVPTEVVEVRSETGRIWMDRNLGASRAAQSVDDYKAYGCMYQWGRGNDGHASMIWTSSKRGDLLNGITNTISKTDTPGDNLFINGYNDWRLTPNNNLWQGVMGINNPCPMGYRIPTLAEFRGEIYQNNIENLAAAFSSNFKFVASGNNIYKNIFTYYSGEIGSYNTSSFPNNSFCVCSIPLLFYPESYSTPNYNRAIGMPVRCIKDKTP